MCVLAVFDLYRYLLTVSLNCSGSQEERISILRMALAEKGFPTSCHQDLAGSEQAIAPAEAQSNGTHRQTRDAGESNGITEQPSSTVDSHDIVIDEDGGIDL